MVTEPVNPIGPAGPTEPIALTQLGIATLLIFTSSWLLVVLKIIKPVAGLLISSLRMVVILGNRTPFDEEVTSNNAEASGLVVPMLICALVSADPKKIGKRKIDSIFFIS